MAEHFISSEQAQNDLLSCAAFLAENIKSNDGRSEAMKAVIPLYLERSDVDFAAELANTIEDPYIRDKMLISVAERCAEIDDVEYAMQLAEAIDDFGPRSQAFERIGVQEASKGRYESAEQIAVQMDHPDYVFAAIAVNRAAAGDDAGAADAIAEIEFANARSFAFQSCAVELISGEKKDKAVGPLEQATEAALEIEHDEERIRALCDIAALFVAAGRRDLSIETYALARDASEVLDNVHRDFFLATCSVGLLHAGSEELADSVLDLVTDKTQMASCLLAFAREDWKNDKKDLAVETLEEANEILRSQKEIETRDARARSVLLTSVAVQFAGFGKTERGIEIADEIVDPTEQVSARSQIAYILTSQKEDDLARQVLTSIDEDGDRLLALIGMSDAKAKLGENAAAVALLNEALDLAETVPQLASRSNVLHEIATRFAAEGEMEKARRVALEILQTITEIRDSSSQSAALAQLAEVYLNAGLTPEDPEKTLLKTLVDRVAW